MSGSRVLVVGATGQLGAVVARKLVAAGVPVRALARDRDKLASAVAGAELAPVDMLDLPKLTEACRGIDQIVATANNNMGKGKASPRRIDLTAYRNLCAAARETGVRRLVYVSFRGVSPGTLVDIFRIKWEIEEAIRQSGVPYVMLRPTAFMDIWVDVLMAAGILENGVTTIFGDGTAVANYIAVDDVAEFAVNVLGHRDVVNEAVDAGGPSDISLNDLATLVERKLGSSGKRRHIPVAAMRCLPPIVRPFNELAARLMTLGHYAATQSVPFPGWKANAERFGVTPRTIETYIGAMKQPAARIGV